MLQGRHKNTTKKQRNTHLDHQIRPLGTEIIRLEWITDITAVQDQFHDKHAVFVVAHAVNDVFSTRTEGLCVRSMHLQEHLKQGWCKV